MVKLKRAERETEDRVRGRKQLLEPGVYAWKNFKNLPLKTDTQLNIMEMKARLQHRVGECHGKEKATGGLQRRVVVLFYRHFFF